MAEKALEDLKHSLLLSFRVSQVGVNEGLQIH